MIGAKPSEGSSIRISSGSNIKFLRWSRMQSSLTLIERIERAYDLKTQGVLPQLLQESERMIILEAIDELWQNHLYAMDALREGVSEFLRRQFVKFPSPILLDRDRPFDR